MPKLKIGILTSALIILALAPSFRVTAADETPLLKSPNETIKEMVEPIKDSFGNALRLVVDIINRVWEVISIGLDWIGEKLVFIFEKIDDWFTRVTGLSIGETLEIIGGFFVNIFNTSLNFLRESFP